MSYEVIKAGEELCFMLDGDGVSLADLIDACEVEFGGDCDFEKVQIETEYEQQSCFGYDLYDSSDWACETKVTYNKSI